MPKVSVVITTHNRKDKLPRAVESVMQQTFEDWEIVLVDDHSTDGTDEVVKTFSEQLGEKIQYIRREENFGQHTRPKNEGILAAKGELIAFLDDDNAFRRDHLQALYKALERNQKADIAYGMRMIVDEYGEKPSIVGITSEYSTRRLQVENYIDTSDVLVKKQALLDVGGWDETIPKYADWNLWVRLAKAGKQFVYVPIILTDYYVHKGMNQLKHFYGVNPATGRELPGFDAVSVPYWATETVMGEAPPLKVAVFSLTYERIDYTKKTFGSMRNLAQYEFHHFVVDNGSKDGTVEWLEGEYKPFHLTKNEINKGISKASNQALDAIKAAGQYDIVIKVDNDCLFLTEGWLKSIIEIFKRHRTSVCGPYVEGLMDNPGGVPRKRVDSPSVSPYGYIGRELVGFAPHIGGICVAAPGWIYDEFRWRDKDFLHGQQDLEFSQYAIHHGYQVFYIENQKVEHMDGTAGQLKRYPDYFERRKREKITQYEGE